MSKRFSQTVESIFPYAVGVRRALHAIPELADKEYKTSEYIFGRLSELGFTPVRILTGMYVDIKGSRGGQKIALRADFDALPITENTGLSFASTNGCMHACGHDAHTAMCLSVAAILSKHPPVNDVRIIFQFAEEGNGGAGRMIEQGVLDGVDMIFALHLSPEIEKGRLATRAGSLFAGGVEFDVSFTGRSSHAATREQGADALLAAADFIKEIRAAEEKTEGVRVHAGKLTSGSARNVVASSALIECTLRYFDGSGRDSMMSAIDEAVKRQEKAHGVSGNIRVLADYMPLINDKKAVELFASKNEIIPVQPQYTAEDFAMYLEKVSGCMVWLGVRDKKHCFPLHSDKFDFDESVMLTGIQALINMTDI